MDRGRPVLIAAASGRALAASARRGGFAPLVADRFGDLDTLDVAERHARADIAHLGDGEPLLATLAALAEGRDCLGIVCGSGFEDRADLLARLAARWRLIGNSPQAVASLKDPLAFARLCREAQVPHPETSPEPPADADGWLVKRIGGAGGWHVRPAGEGRAGEGVYFQRQVAGEAVSALLLGNGRDVMVLGFSAQWTAPTARHPYRYGGAVRPAPLAPGVRAAMEAAIARLAGRVPLAGLASADFLVEGARFHLLEINPRPGATFDLFEPDGGSLFALHVEACGGVLPARKLELDGAMAGAILYADRAIAQVPALRWPDWTADRPAAGSGIDRDEPVCSVFARADTAAAARDLVVRRMAQIRALIEGARS
jgi:predicted ATP-grasp superfamily ATP-dependent carboligase